MGHEVLTISVSTCRSLADAEEIAHFLTCEIGVRHRRHANLIAEYVIEQTEEEPNVTVALEGNISVGKSTLMQVRTIVTIFILPVIRDVICVIVIIMYFLLLLLLLLLLIIIIIIIMYLTVCVVIAAYPRLQPTHAIDDGICVGACRTVARCAWTQYSGRLLQGQCVLTEWMFCSFGLLIVFFHFGIDMLFHFVRRHHII